MLQAAKDNGIPDNDFNRFFFMVYEHRNIFASHFWVANLPAYRLCTLVSPRKPHLLNSAFTIIRQNKAIFMHDTVTML